MEVKADKDDYTSIPCIIPTAGRSSRMGSWKPLLPWGEGTLCQAVLEAVESGGCRPILVAGYRAEELIGKFENRPGLTMVINENWEKGMLGSILKGAESIKKPGFLVVPADMPFIPASLFRNLVTEAEQRQNRGESEAAIFAAHKGKLGHPVWIPAFFLAEMKKLPPDAKLREYLLTQPWVALEAGTEGIWIDIDNPRDYAKAEKLGRFHPP